jgi:hypothetical protein
MKAKLEPLDTKYYKTRITITDDDDNYKGLISINIDPEEYTLEQISPRESIPYSEIQDITWNHIETKNSYNVANFIVAFINAINTKPEEVK